MQTYLLDAALPPYLQKKEDNRMKKLQKQRQKEEKKKQKKEQKEQKKKEKELKKQAKQEAVGKNQTENTINLSQRTGNTTEQMSVQDNNNQQNVEMASVSLSTILLIGAAILLLCITALFYRKQRQ